jgi:glycosyltransferase involved in cell wall biosynthesis
MAMRASIVIASHNEGDLLWRTIRSCQESIRDLDYEVVVADDASTDGSLESLRRRCPEARIVAHSRRLGCSAAKDTGARSAIGDVIVFLDGHCKPEKWAVVRLVNDVEDSFGQAIFTPRVAALDCARWKNSKRFVGFGYRISLLTFASAWVPAKKMRWRGAYLESPSLVGCCVAISRKLYLKLRGFDPHMHEWGVEDVDLGLKAWLMGSAILNNPHAVIGHRFRDGFTNFTVATESVLANQLRSARKSFQEGTWRDWLRRFRARHPRRWGAAWKLFESGRRTVEQERDYLLRARMHDEAWYAERFGLRWPRRPSEQGHPIVR